MCNRNFNRTAECIVDVSHKIYFRCLPRPKEAFTQKRPARCPRQKRRPFPPPAMSPTTGQPPPPSSSRHPSNFNRRTRLPAAASTFSGPLLGGSPRTSPTLPAVVLLCRHSRRMKSPTLREVFVTDPCRLSPPMLLRLPQPTSRASNR